MLFILYIFLNFVFMIEKEIYKKVGEKLKSLRIKKGYSASETFAYDHDLSRISYYKMEQGTNMTLKSLLKVLKIHNISLSQFFKDFK